MFDATTPTLWQQLEPVVVNVLLVLVPIAGTALAAWLRAKATQFATAKQIVAEVERQFTPIPGVMGSEKKQIAMQRISQAMPRMPEQKASDLVERVLPEVRRESDAPPSTRRSSSSGGS